MSAHLTLPYNWENCTEPENCQKYIHWENSAKELNSYPREWVEELLPTECLDENRNITLYNPERNIHAENGPAIEHPNGTLEWYQNGERRRIDGPAIIYPDKSETWYREGKLHREDGPAATWTKGSKEWFLNDERHRIDGPAVIKADGTMSFYLYGKKTTAPDQK